MSLAQTDTLRSTTLDSIIVSASPSKFLPEVQGLNIYSGKRTNDIIPDATGANLSANVVRMALARIPGINVWEMDGAGTQVNIGSDFDLSLTKPYGIDLHLHTNNYAVFAEDLAHVTSRFSVTPGEMSRRLTGLICMRALLRLTRWV